MSADLPILINKIKAINSISKIKIRDVKFMWIYEWTQTLMLVWEQYWKMWKESPEFTTVTSVLY